MSRRFMIHCCLLSPHDWRYRVSRDTARKLGIKHEWTPPPRLHINTPWVHVGVALWRSGRFASLVGYKPGMTREQAMKLPIKNRWAYARRHRKDRDGAPV